MYLLTLKLITMYLKNTQGHVISQSKIDEMINFSNNVLTAIEQRRLLKLYPTLSVSQRLHIKHYALRVKRLCHTTKYKSMNDLHSQINNYLTLREQTPLS